MEYLNVYDNNKNLLDKKVIRGTTLGENEHIMITIIFLENDKSEYLMQKN